MAKPTDEDLENRFKHHPPTGDRGAHHCEVRKAALEFARVLRAFVPDGRELALAITRVEEAMMWGNAGIARQG